MTENKPRIRWYVYVGTGLDRERIPFESTMRGRWDFDATCSCGWDSQTGGGLRNAVRRAVVDHKWDAHDIKPSWLR